MGMNVSSPSFHPSRPQLPSHLCLAHLPSPPELQFVNLQPTPQPPHPLPRLKTCSAVLLDVRLAQRYDDSHAERAISAPLYRPIEGWDVPSTLRRVAFSLFGIFPGTGEWAMMQSVGRHKGTNGPLMLPTKGILQGRVLHGTEVRPSYSL